MSLGPHSTTSNRCNTEDEFQASRLQPHSLSRTNSEYPRSHPKPTFGMFSSLLKLGWFIFSLLNTSNQNCVVLCGDALIPSTAMKKCLACPRKTCCDEVECVVLGL